MTWLPGFEPFDVIVADPPWSYENVRTGGSLASGAAAKYPTMSLDEIVAMRPFIDRIVAQDSVLFLWAVSPLLDQAFDVVRGWGFSYWGSLYWIKKDRLGMGWVVRNQIEPCFIARRGEVPPLRLGRNDLYAKPGRHSEKPEEFWAQVEPALDRLGLNRRLELFARAEREGWWRWGRDAPDGERLLRAQTPAV